MFAAPDSLPSLFYKIMSVHPDDLCEEDDYILVEAPEIVPHVAKAPRLLVQQFVLPYDHALVFDYFCGIPTLHVRPRSAERHGADVKPEPLPPEATEIPFRMEIVFDLIRGGTAQILFWVRSGEEGLKPTPAKQQAGALHSLKSWVGMTIGCVQSVMRGLEAPRFFTFFPGMTVLYVREPGWKMGFILVNGRHYCKLSKPPKEMPHDMQLVISALEPHTVIF